MDTSMDISSEEEGELLADRKPSEPEEGEITDTGSGAKESSSEFLFFTTPTSTWSIHKPVHSSASSMSNVAAQQPSFHTSTATVSASTQNSGGVYQGGSRWLHSFNDYTGSEGKVDPSSRARGNRKDIDGDDSSVSSLGLELSDEEEQEKNNTQKRNFKHSKQMDRFDCVSQRFSRRNSPDRGRRSLSPPLPGGRRASRAAVRGRSNEREQRPRSLPRNPSQRQLRTADAKSGSAPKRTRTAVAVERKPSKSPQTRSKSSQYSGDSKASKKGQNTKNQEKQSQKTPRDHAIRVIQSAATGVACSGLSPLPSVKKFLDKNAKLTREQHAQMAKNIPPVPTKEQLDKMADSYVDRLLKSVKEEASERGISLSHLLHNDVVQIAKAQECPRTERTTSSATNAPIGNFAYPQEINTASMAVPPPPPCPPPPPSLENLQAVESVTAQANMSNVSLTSEAVKGMTPGTRHGNESPPKERPTKTDSPRRQTPMTSSTEEEGEITSVDNLSKLRAKVIASMRKRRSSSETTKEDSRNVNSSDEGSAGKDPTLAKNAKRISERRERSAKSDGDEVVKKNLEETRCLPNSEATENPEKYNEGVSGNWQTVGDFDLILRSCGCEPDEPALSVPAFTQERFQKLIAWRLLQACIRSCIKVHMRCASCLNTDKKVKLLKDKTMTWYQQKLQAAKHIAEAIDEDSISSSWDYLFRLHTALWELCNDHFPEALGEIESIEPELKRPSDGHQRRLENIVACAPHPLLLGVLYFNTAEDMQKVVLSTKAYRFSELKDDSYRRFLSNMDHLSELLECGTIVSAVEFLTDGEVSSEMDVVSEAELNHCARIINLHGDRTCLDYFFAPVAYMQNSVERLPKSFQLTLDSLNRFAPSQCTNYLLKLRKASNTQPKDHSKDRRKSPESTASSKSGPSRRNSQDLTSDLNHLQEKAEDQMGTQSASADTAIAKRFRAVKRNHRLILSQKDQNTSSGFIKNMDFNSVDQDVFEMFENVLEGMNNEQEIKSRTVRWAIDHTEQKRKRKRLESEADVWVHGNESKGTAVVNDKKHSMLPQQKTYKDQYGEQWELLNSGATNAADRTSRACEYKSKNTLVDHTQLPSQYLTGKLCQSLSQDTRTHFEGNVELRKHLSTGENAIDGDVLVEELPSTLYLEETVNNWLAEQEKTLDENAKKLLRHDQKIQSLSKDKRKLDNLIEKSSSIMDMQKETVKQSKAEFKDLYGKLQQLRPSKRKRDQPNRVWKRNSSS